MRGSLVRIAARGVTVGRLPTLTDHQRASILEAYRLGVPQARIAKHLRLGRSTISKTIRRYGDTWPCTRLPLSDFLSECWLHESAVCETATLWLAWQWYCEQRGIDAGTQIAFGRALVAAAKCRGFQIGRKKVGRKGRQVWAYTGIAISQRSPLCAAS
jgi:Homeodomain-like domain